jgi:putative transposase
MKETNQVVKAIKESESGRSVTEISRELGINPQTFNNWKKKYSGIETQDLLSANSSIH